jgi:hypothetical protein
MHVGSGGQIVLSLHVVVGDLLMLQIPASLNDAE